MSSKFRADKIFVCDDLAKFAKYVIRILPYKGVSMSKFYLCEYADTQFLVKLSMHEKSRSELFDTKSPPNTLHTSAEIQILTILKNVITNKNLSPGILELIYYKTCDKISKTSQLSEKKCAKYLTHVDSDPATDVKFLICNYVDMVHNNIAIDKISWLVLDKCDMTLGEYLFRLNDSAINKAIFKSLLFQIIQTMYIINRVFPKFRHNDLHANNIMLKFDREYTFNATAPKYLVYNIRSRQYIVPYFGIIMKIIDYGHSSLPEHEIYNSVQRDPIANYNRSDNDLLFLFSVINAICHVIKNEYIPEWLSQLEPNQSYTYFLSQRRRKLETNGKIPTYHDMITNHCWDEYLSKNIISEHIYTEFNDI